MRGSFVSRGPVALTDRPFSGHGASTTFPNGPIAKGFAMPSDRSTGNGASLPRFLQQALKHGINTREEERRLARRAARMPKKPAVGRKRREEQRRRHRSAFDARDALVTTNLRFILQQALHHARFGAVEADDAFQEAALGHLEAIGRFKTSAGTRLSTYSSWWIRHAVMRYGQDHGRNVRVPVNTLEKARKIAKKAQAFERKHGRLPDDDELSALTGIPRARIDQVRIAVMDAVSLDEVHRDDDGVGRTLKDLVPDKGPGPEAALERDTAIAAVGRALAVLEPFEAAIIRCRFYENKTLVETAAALADQTRHGRELSRERIRQVEAAALRKLRAALAELDPR